MPISNEKKIVFVHIPKTSGTSIEAMLGLKNDRNNSNYSNLMGRINPDIKKALSCRSNYLQHLTFSEIVKLLGPESIMDYTKFTVVRNPWDRLVSCYCNMDSNLVRVALESGIKLADMSFHDFVESTLSIEHVHLVPQHEFVSQAHGQSLNRVFKFEFLHELHRFMNDEMGISNSMPRLNSSKRDSYRNYYDKNLVQIVAERYKADIDMFNYEF